jgi:hypothetical protein
MNYTVYSVSVKELRKLLMEEDEEEEEEVDKERDIEILRRKLNENMEKNASMMIKKHDCKRNIETREYSINSVSSSINKFRKTLRYIQR